MACPWQAAAAKDNEPYRKDWSAAFAVCATDKTRNTVIFSSIQSQNFNPSCKTALSSSGSLSRVANNSKNHISFLLKSVRRWSSIILLIYNVINWSCISKIILILKLSGNWRMIWQMKNPTKPIPMRFRQDWELSLIAWYTQSAARKFLAGGRGVAFSTIILFFHLFLISGACHTVLSAPHTQQYQQELPG